MLLSMVVSVVADGVEGMARIGHVY